MSVARYNVLKAKGKSPETKTIKKLKEIITFSHKQVNKVEKIVS
jgi:hypothetical protein